LVVEPAVDVEAHHHAAGLGELDAIPGRLALDLGTAAPDRMPDASVDRGELPGAVRMAGAEIADEGLAVGEADPSLALHRPGAPAAFVDDSVADLEMALAVGPAVLHRADIVAVDGARVVGRR